MKSPIYLTYAEFISKYENDLSAYKLDYPDLTEREFLIELKRKYFKLQNFIERKTISFYDYNNNEEIETDLSWYCIMLNKRYGEFLKFLKYQNEELENQHPEKELFSWERNYEVIKIDYQFQLRYFIEKSKDWDISEHWFYINFVKFEEWSVIEDIEKWKNFSFSKERIVNFIDNKLNNETTDDKEIIPENDFIDTPKLERMIILEKLGVIDYIKSLQNNPDNEKQTAEILSSFTGINSGTIAKNLGVMLGKKNDTDKNSPYKNPINLQLANKKLTSFNIDLAKKIK